MIDYIPNLLGRDILMISDYISEAYDEDDLKIEKDFLKTVKKDLNKYGINFFFLEVENIKELEQKLKKFNKDKVVIFNWCEEINGKTNSAHIVTDYWDKNEWKYSGSKTECLKVSLDRTRINKVLKENNVSVPKQYKFNENGITFPVILKAAKEHGSYGISSKSIIENKNQWDSVLADIDKNKFIAEQFIDGFEYTVSVWGCTGSPEVLPIFKINFVSNAKEKYKIVYYDSKWNKQDAGYAGIFAAPEKTIDKRLANELINLSLKAFNALKCCGFCRMEIRVKDNKGYLTDLNTNPNFRPDSSFIKSAVESGYNYGQIVAKLCEFALRE